MINKYGSTSLLCDVVGELKTRIFMKHKVRVSVQCQSTSVNISVVDNTSITMSIVVMWFMTKIND